MIPQGGTPAGTIYTISGRNMQSPVNKLVQLRVAEYISGKIPQFDPYTEREASQEEYQPLRENSMLCDAFITALRFEITTLLSVSDKSRRVILKNKEDVRHKSLVQQRDSVWEDYEVLRRLICPENKLLQIERAIFRYI